MRSALFDYRLPPELIAQRPLMPREGSRLLAVDCDAARVEHRRFLDLPAYLREGDCLVFNSSRVRRARLLGRKGGGGGEVELLLLRRLEGAEWEALARPARRLRPGSGLVFASGELRGEVLEKGERGLVRVRMCPEDPGRVEALLERYGMVPLPPYIREELEDPERYQTVFAQAVGSAAAPTAGLHFGQDTLRALRERGIGTAFVRLDVGLDTFRPITEEEVEDHRIHSEEASLDEEACARIEAARAGGGRVVAVGTTVVRVLESAAARGGLAPFAGPTSLFIYPGFRFRAVDCLLTNFHMPRSSLLLLVSAFAGRELVMEAYRQAVEEGYRFLSFGDACYFHFDRAWSPGGLGGGGVPGTKEGS